MAKAIRFGRGILSILGGKRISKKAECSYTGMPLGGSKAWKVQWYARTGRRVLRARDQRRALPAASSAVQRFPEPLGAHTLAFFGSEVSGPTSTSDDIPRLIVHSKVPTERVRLGGAHGYIRLV